MTGEAVRRQDHIDAANQQARPPRKYINVFLYA